MSTYFMNTDTFKYWNEEKKAWVDTMTEATDLGHGKTKITKPKGSVRVSSLASEIKQQANQ